MLHPAGRAVVVNMVEAGSVNPTYIAMRYDGKGQYIITHGTIIHNVPEPDAPPSPPATVQQCVDYVNRFTQKRWVVVAMVWLTDETAW